MCAHVRVNTNYWNILSAAWAYSVCVRGSFHDLSAVNPFLAGAVTKAVTYAALLLHTQKIRYLFLHFLIFYFFDLPFRCRTTLCESNHCMVPAAKGNKWAQSKLSKECKHCDRIKKCVERPQGTHVACMSLSLVILHQRFPQWQFIIALPLLSLTYSLSLCCLLNSASLSFALALQSFL